MSLENAILEHAAAIRELAGAILKTATPRSVETITVTVDPSKVKEIVEKNAEETAEKKAAEEAKNDASGAAKTTGTSAGAPQEDAKAKAIREAKEAAAAAAPAPTDDKPLDYMKEVVPVMNDAVKLDRPAVVALLATFGAKKGAEVPAARHRELLAGCQKIVAEAKAG